MEAKVLTPSDRQMAADMLSTHYTGSAGKFPVDFLPETGVAVVDDGKTVCVIPVYLESTSSVAVLGHFIAAGGVSPKKLHRAAALAIEAAKRFARAAGKKYVVAIFGRRSINKIADTMGFTTTDHFEEKFCYIGGGF